jgi:hypothetical protein
MMARKREHDRTFANQTKQNIYKNEKNFSTSAKKKKNFSTKSE